MAKRKGRPPKIDESGREILREAPVDELEPVGRHPAGAAVRTRPLARRSAPAGTEGMERSSFEPARGGPTGVR